MLNAFSLDTLAICHPCAQRKPDGFIVYVGGLICGKLFAAQDRDQSSHWFSGQLPSSMTSMHWIGWLIQSSRGYTLQNRCLGLLML